MMREASRKIALTPTTHMPLTQQPLTGGSGATIYLISNNTIRYRGQEVIRKPIASQVQLRDIEKVHSRDYLRGRIARKTLHRSVACKLVPQHCSKTGDCWDTYASDLERLTVMPTNLLRAGVEHLQAVKTYPTNMAVLR